MIDDRTPGRGYPLPNIDNELEDDVARLATALRSLDGDVIALISGVALRAPTASPTFTGQPTAPTPAPGDASKSVATAEFVSTAVSTRAPTASPTFTGNASFSGVLSVAGSIVSGDACYVNDRSGTGHRSSVYRNNDTTRFWDYAYGDTIVYDTAGNVTIPGKLSIGTPLSVASGGTGAGTALTALAGLGAGLIGDQPYNMMLVAGVASNALTVSVLGANGLAPSLANPVLIPFRDNNRIVGDLTVVSITSALSITIPSGATLGTKSGVPCRIWIVAIASSSGNAPSLGVQVCTDAATTIYPLIEGAGQAATAIGTGSTSAGVLYAPAAVSGGSTRILGAVEFVAGQATAGTWATAPSSVLRHLSGGKKPGDTVQVVTAANGTTNNNNTNAYSANGSFQGIGASITPTSTINAVRVRTSGGLLYNPGSNSNGLIRLTRGASGVTLAEGGEYFFANGGSWGQYSGMQTSPSLEGLDFPGTTSTTSYGTQLKNSDNSSNVTYPNGGFAARINIEELVV